MSALTNPQGIWLRMTSASSAPDATDDVAPALYGPDGPRQDPCSNAQLSQIPMPSPVVTCLAAGT